MSQRHHRPRPGQIHIPHGVLHASHVVASSVALAVVFLLALDQRFGWLRHSPGGDAFDLNEQPWFMVFFAIGALVALKWQLLGGAISTFTAAGLVVFASRQLQPADATLVIVAFAIPGLLWLVVGLFELRDERFHRHPAETPRPLLRRRDVAGGMALIAVTGVGGLRIAAWLFDRIYGPTHPESRVPAAQGSVTRWTWSGAISDSTAAVTARLEDDDETDVALVVSTSPTLIDPLVVSTVPADEGYARVDLSGLDPDTRYHYAWAIRGVADRNRLGSFRTAPRGPASFSIAVSGCNRTGSNGLVWDTIRSLDPLLMIVNGDLHYADIADNDGLAYRQIIDHQLGRPAPAALFARCPVAYMWDDHDWGGADGDAGSRPAAMAIYRQAVPHYPLQGATSTIHQAFTIGRVRFILTDARSDREPADDGLPGTMLGARQKAWFAEELRTAAADHAAVVWVNPVPWISEAVEGGDDWSGFAEERAEVADMIADADLTDRLVMLCGDAHMVALDDGTNTDYSTDQVGGFPLLHAAALDRPGSVKGGPYSHGSFPGGGQFGHLVVDDDGTSVTITMTGRNWRNEILVEHRCTI